MNRRFYQLTLRSGTLGDQPAGGQHAHHHARLLDAMTQAERDALATGVAALLRAMGQPRPSEPGSRRPPLAATSRNRPCSSPGRGRPLRPWLG